MNNLSIIGLINFLTSISLGGFVFYKDPKSKLNRSYFSFNLMIAIYSFGYFMWQYTPQKYQLELWFKILFHGVILINTAYLFFVFVLIEKLFEKKNLLILWVIVNVIFLILLNTNQLYGQFEKRFNLGYWPTPKLFFHLYVVCWHWSCFYGFYWLIRAMNMSIGIKKLQIKYVMLACLIGYLGGVSNWPVFYNFNTFPYFTVGISMYVALIAYSIVRYKLMDLNLIVRWGFVYAVSFGSIFIILFSVTLLLEKIFHDFFNVGSKLPTIIGISLVISVFEPIRTKIKIFADRIIFRSPDFQLMLSGIDSELNNARDIHSLTDGLIVQIKKILKVNHAGFAIWNNSQASFQLFPHNSFGNQIISRIDEKIAYNDFLVKSLQSERRLFKYGIITEDELAAFKNKTISGEKATFGKIQRTMRWLGASLCVPLMAGNELMGFLILGNKTDNSFYNEEDKKFLSHVAEKVSIVTRVLFSSL